MIEKAKGFFINDIKAKNPSILRDFNFKRIFF